MKLQVPSASSIALVQVLRAKCVAKRSQFRVSSVRLADALVARRSNRTIPRDYKKKGFSSALTRTMENWTFKGKSFELSNRIVSHRSGRACTNENLLSEISTHGLFHAFVECVLALRV